jgi:hypothetical protein
VEICKERMSAAQFVYKSCQVMRGRNRAPELFANTFHQVADQFFGYPILRLRFLGAIVELNEKEGLFAQAYVAQVQIAALIDYVVKGIGQELVPDLDFSFSVRTSDERRIDLNHCKDDVRPLLYDHPQFNAAGLIVALRKAVDLARRANLHWQYRQIYFVLMTVLKVRHNYGDLRAEVAGLGEAYDAVAAHPESPLHFYIVEERRYGRVIKTQVFSSSCANLVSF